MQSRTEVYSLPRGRLARWLTAPGQDTPHEIRVALVGTLFGTLPIFFGGVFNTIAVAWVIEARHPTALFRFWLCAELLICAVRLVVLVISRRRALQQRPTPTDLYITLAPLWGATVGYGAFVSAISGDWVAATLSFLSAAAMVGGICFRNFAAPRLVAVMIVLSLGPCAIGALLSGEHVLLLTLVQIPFYLFAMSAAARRLNALLISTMKAERENRHHARHDMLTGLLNRAGLFNAANGGKRARIRAGMTLFYLDLDGRLGGPVASATTWAAHGTAGKSARPPDASARPGGGLERMQGVRSAGRLVHRSGHSRAGPCHAGETRGPKRPRNGHDTDMGMTRNAPTPRVLPGHRHACPPDGQHRRRRAFGVPQGW
ncbi:GGDEF domain-containing protein [Burkholderia glumae]|uniref:GGDEF domain-containing protein n=1 Tax=Burkholderia glumae TaxID=337 RepID=UPI0020B2993B|nr:GGDEF domain-containing protein [Burkholderia glumae]